LLLLLVVARSFGRVREDEGVLEIEPLYLFEPA